MSPYIVPWRSGVHRAAGIALFRELLKSSRSVTFDDSTQNDIQNVVRNRFKQNRLVQSKRLLGIAFNAGYEARLPNERAELALDLVDAANDGDAASLTQILTLLSQSRDEFKQPPKLAPLEPTPSVKKPPISPKDPSYSIFDRPREQISGWRRRVPTLVVSQGIPFLRIKKPQPRGLSVYFNNRIKLRVKRHDRARWLENEMIPLANREDRWDEILEQEFGSLLIDGNDHEGAEFDLLEPPWSKEYVDLFRFVKTQLWEETQKNAEMYRKFVAVVERERELAKKEKEERRTLWEQSQDSSDGQRCDVRPGSSLEP